MTYETLDTIADAYNPAWLLCVAITVFIGARHQTTARKKARHILGECSLILLYAIWIYGWMFIDNALHLWPKLNADYSTHTAVAVALSGYLVLHLKRPLQVVSAIVLISYCALMLYQKYHTAFDMLSTAAFTAIGITAINHVKRRYSQKH